MATNTSKYARVDLPDTTKTSGDVENSEKFPAVTENERKTGGKTDIPPKSDTKKTKSQ